jgi:hypothetical protein
VPPISYAEYLPEHRRMMRACASSGAMRRVDPIQIESGRPRRLVSGKYKALDSSIESLRKWQFRAALHLPCRSVAHIDAYASWGLLEASP